MGYEGDPPEALEGVGPSFVEALYQRYLDAPGSVDVSWQRYSDGVEGSVPAGPSGARPNWPLTPTDSLTASLDPMQMEIEAKPAKKGAAPAAPAASALSTADIQRAADASIR